MPTGYTADVESGKTTELNDFVLHCARAFGALVSLRDDFDAPIPEKIEPDTAYYDKRIGESLYQLSQLQAYTPEQVEYQAERAHEEAVSRWKEQDERRLVRRARYQEMLEKVLAWQPPTEEHRELHKFMISQLRDSIRHDCDYESPRPERIEPGKWLQEAIEDAGRALAYSARSRYEEIERAKGRTEWVQQLLSSLRAHKNDSEGA